MKKFAPTFAVALIVAAPVLAGSHVVLFEDGRTLEVENFEQQAAMTVLDLGGGATIAVPNERISGFEAVRLTPATRTSATAAQPARVARSSAEAQAQPAVQRRSRANGAGNRWRTAAGQYADVVARAAEKHDLDPALLAAVAHVESRFNPRAVSPKGAQGILQLMPATAKRFGVKDSFDVSQNVDAGARYLSWLLDRYEGRTDLALAGYNAGENAVDRYKGIPPFPETRTYVTRVMRQADQLGLR